ncbi:MAG TPA: translocation/assembly module TamB domain-containing protein, partial [Polyangiaceae bacterium]|nr:translocation/assembly module TamB domain-containing protein [Polyangiaceae bacterium]
MANLRRKVSRVLAKVARWTGYLLAGVVGLVVVLLLCINLKPLREFIRARANAALADTFVGTLTIRRIGYISPYSLGGVDADVRDGKGRLVLRGLGLSATCHWPGIVWDLIRKRPLTVTLSPVNSDHIEVVLIDDGKGSPTLASAFSPRTPSPEQPATQSAPTTISIPDLRARHIWVHGGLQALPSIDTELSRLALSLRSKGSELDAKLSNLSVVARNLPGQVNPRGKFLAQVNVRGEPQSKIKGFVDFNGTLAGAPTVLHGEFDDKRVGARLDAREIPASTITAQVPALTPRGPTGLEVNARGTLPRIEFDGKLDNEALRAVLTGHVSLEETTFAHAEVDAKQIDASGWVATAPKTNLALVAKVDAEVPKAGPTFVHYDVSVPSGSVQGAITPELKLRGKLVQSKDAGLSVDGALDADERGITLAARFLYTQGLKQNQAVTGSLSLELKDSPRVRQLTGATLNGTVRANTELDLSNERILSAKANVALSPVVHGTDRIDSLSADVAASGSLKAPELDVRAQARNGNLGGQRFQRLNLSGSGTPARFVARGTVDRDERQRIEFGTTISSGNATELLGTTLAVLSRDEKPINLRARRVRIGGGQLRFEQVELDGPGTVALSGQYGGGRADAEFDVQALDVGRLTRTLRVNTPIQRALVTAKGRVKGPLRRLQGELEAHVTQLDMEHVRGGNVDVDLRIHNQVASGTVAANLGDSRVTAKVEQFVVPAPDAAITPTSLSGKLEVRGSVELARVANALRSAGAPLERASGHLDIDLDAERAPGGPLMPRAELRVKTKSLKLVEQRPPKKGVSDASDARATQPRSLDGVDVDATVSLDPQENKAKVLGSLFDQRGPMLELDAETHLPKQGLPLGAALSATTVKVSARIPARELDQLPRSVRPPSMHGVVQANVEAEGNLRSPKLMATAGVRGFRTREGGRRAMNAELMLRYDKARGELRGSASTSRQPNALFVDTRWDGDLVGKFMDENAPLDLDAEVKLDRFPTGVVPMLADRSVKGPVSCDIKLEDWGKDAKLTGTLDGSGMKLSGVQLSKLDVSFNTENERISALVDVREQDGTLRLDASTPLTWGHSIAPTVDPHLKANLKARRFQLDTMSPFVSQYLSTLEGELNADFGLEMGQDAPKLQGSAEIRDGVVQIPQVGQRFSDVQAKLSVDPNGKVRLEKLQARGTSGRVTADAEATLRGTNVESAKLAARITKAEKLPVTLEGVALGDAWGKLNVNYRHADGTNDIRVDIPEFQMQMPEAGFGNVQGLDPDEHIRIGVYRGDKTFAAIPTQPLRASESDTPPAEPPTVTRVAVHLGDSVWIQRGTQAKVQLGGELNITSGEESQIRGRIDLRGGQLDVNGKTFNIENGTVTFEGDDPGNPTIVATARWDAPDSYSVYAEYRGTVKAGKLTLRSEPPLTQPEIVSLLLFGSPEGSLGQSNGGGGGAAATAVGVAGDTAVRGFNRVMSDFTHLDVSARIDTSTGSARPEIVVQVTPRLTTRVTRALGEPPPGESPDRTFLTLELRLQRSWAVSAVVGDRGASV